MQKRPASEVMKKCVCYIICLIIMLPSCRTGQRRVVYAEEQLIAVDSTADSLQDTEYIEVLRPKTDSLNRQLNVVIGFAPESMTVGKPESTMLNWASDVLYDMAREVYKGDVDFSVVNIGGVRTRFEKGDITRRHIYELMPFDNRLVILTMQGSDVIDLCEEFARQGGQGVSRQLRMEIADGKARKIQLNGRQIVPEAVYYVATSDYLSTGADHLTPLTKAIEKYDTGIKIRNLYMQYVEQHKVVNSQMDGRMKMIN